MAERGGVSEVAGSAAGGEEALQQLGRAGLADAAIDLWRVMAGGSRKEARTMLDGAALRIWSAEIEPADAGKGDGRCAHGARLERNIQVATGEPLAGEFGAGLPNGDELGMRGGIAELKHPVSSVAE